MSSRDEPARASGPACPERAILVHVGPSKTGTTALQHALDASRDALRRQQVRYGWRTWHDVPVARAALVDGPAWRRFVEWCARVEEPTVVVSSEVLARCDDAAARRLVTDLRGRRVHVLITLRPLERILPSQWQQYLRAGERRALDPWLHDVFEGRGRRARRFWRDHRHDALVARWADAAGPDRVTVLVIGAADRGRLYREVEALLGVAPGTLRPGRQVNPSLGATAADHLCAFNDALERAHVRPGAARAARRLVLGAYRRLVRHGAGRPIELPGWAWEPAAREGARAAAAIRASGVHLVGAVELLAGSPAPGPHVDRSPGTRPPGSRAARAAIALAVPVVRVAGVLAAALTVARRPR